MHHFVGALVYHSGGSQVVQKLSGRGVDRASARGDEIKVPAPGGWHFQARSLVMDWTKTASLRSRLGFKSPAPASTSARSAASPPDPASPAMPGDPPSNLQSAPPC